MACLASSVCHTTFIHHGLDALAEATTFHAGVFTSWMGRSKAPLQSSPAEQRTEVLCAADLGKGPSDLIAHNSAAVAPLQGSRMLHNMLLHVKLCYSIQATQHVLVAFRMTLERPGGLGMHRTSSAPDLGAEHCRFASCHITICLLSQIK